MLTSKVKIAQMIQIAHKNFVENKNSFCDKIIIQNILVEMSLAQKVTISKIMIYCLMQHASSKPILGESMHQIRLET